VPACNAEHHGYELLATIDSTDTKFSCNLAHGLYSWMGAASEGGYLGADAQSFFSAVVSGAAGVYIVTLTEDAGISTDLVIEPGQDVRVSGDPGLAIAPSWGSGGFTVQERGLLSGVALAGRITVQGGGSVSVRGGSVDSESTVAANARLHLTNVVHYHYHPEERRAVSRRGGRRRRRSRDPPPTAGRRGRRRDDECVCVY
jgi:hypothetical protein